MNKQLIGIRKCHSQRKMNHSSTFHETNMSSENARQDMKIGKNIVHPFKLDLVLTLSPT